MRFVYGGQDWATRERGQENVYLLTNGLGGFSCASMINSNTRNDQAFLMASLRAPNLRYNMVNRLEEVLESGDRVHLSSQEFTDAAHNENGYLYLNSFVYKDYPEWTFQADGVEVVKRVVMVQGKNLVAVQYRIDNRTDAEVRLTVTPHLQFVPKGQPLTGKPKFTIRQCSAVEEARMPERCGDETRMPERCGGGKRMLARCCGEETGARVRSAAAAAGKDAPAEVKQQYGVYEIASGELRLYIRTNGETEIYEPRFCGGAYYAYDACDGRESEGRTCILCDISRAVPPHADAVLEIVCGADREIPVSAEPLFDEASEYRRGLRKAAEGGLHSAAALQLAVSANQFISRRESTGGQTILAGYPFFEDWGRDTMIALEGCCMSTGQYDTAKSILRTFAAYCRKGLMPNLFPEGGSEPRYNTADAALLFISSVYTYVLRTGDDDFVREMWPVMAGIIEAYRDGTDYGICMDGDGLIRAGLEYDQVTWMDVRIDNHLPTPRHGKPVEINAYWYNALKVMEKLGSGPYFKGPETPVSGDWPPADHPAAFGSRCGRLAELTKNSFLGKFWMEDKGWLKDVLSGTKADEQFRCNQIWAVSMPFSMIDRRRARRIVDAVYEKLYTPYGLRTLAMDDPEFHGTYGGELRARDLAYHQGTVWVFPLGAYYLAYLRSRDHTPDAVRTVRRQLEALESAMREGCIGQLPEIYDGGRPAFSRGCFAQAWSVGELLRVYEAVESGETVRERGGYE